MINMTDNLSDLFKELLDDPIIKKRLQELIKDKEKQSKDNSKMKVHHELIEKIDLAQPQEIKWEEICNTIYICSHDERSFSLLERVPKYEKNFPLVYRCNQRGLFSYWIKEKKKDEKKRYAILLFSFTYPNIKYEFDNVKQDNWDKNIFKSWSNEDIQIALIVYINKSKKSSTPTKFFEFNGHFMLSEEEKKESELNENDWKTAFVFVGMYNLMNNPIKLSKIKFWNFKQNKISTISAKISQNVRGGRFCHLSENEFIKDMLKYSQETYGNTPVK